MSLFSILKFQTFINLPKQIFQYKIALNTGITWELLLLKFASFLSSRTFASYWHEITHFLGWNRQIFVLLVKCQLVCLPC